MEWGTIGGRFEHVAEGADAAGGQRLNRAGGDSVDANVLGAEVPGEIANRSFERCFGRRHHVVMGYNFFRGEISESDDASALIHERRGGAADGDERVDADVVGDAEAFAAGVDKRALEVFGRRECDGMDEDVEAAVAGLEFAK